MAGRKKQTEQTSKDNATPQTAEVRVANRLRQLRADKGLTLKELAERVDLSSAFLSRVENHKVSITLASLERISTALEAPLSAFFEDEQLQPPIVLCRDGKGTQGRIRGRNGLMLKLLAASKRGKLMEPILVDITSASEAMPLITHSGEEFNYIVEGEVVLLYGKDEIVLYKGDSVYYDATVPHAARAVPGKPGMLLSVVASKDYLFHGDLSKLLKGTNS
ncbi:MAG: cupin domain-containing protein [Chthoniobacterales bacterium]